MAVRVVQFSLVVSPLTGAEMTESSGHAFLPAACRIFAKSDFTLDMKHCKAAHLLKSYTICSPPAHTRCACLHNCERALLLSSHFKDSLFFPTSKINVPSSILTSQQFHPATSLLLFPCLFVTTRHGFNSFTSSFSGASHIHKNVCEAHQRTMNQ